MKKILLLIAIIVTLVLALTAYFGADTLISINALSIVPFALFFVIGVTGVGEVRFKDEEDGKLSKEECSLPVKTVAKIRHAGGFACLIGCIPELFLVFFVAGFPKVLFSLVTLIVFFALAWKVRTFELAKALKENGK